MYGQHKLDRAGLIIPSKALPAVRCIFCQSPDARSVRVLEEGPGGRLAYVRRITCGPCRVNRLGFLPERQKEIG